MYVRAEADRTKTRRENFVIVSSVHGKKSLASSRKRQVSYPCQVQEADLSGELVGKRLIVIRSHKLQTQVG